LGTRAQALSAYFSVSFLDRLRVDPTVSGSVLCDASTAAVLSVDIEGSCLLAERLGNRGAAGAEELGRVLNHCLAPLVDLVILGGGDVVKFAGDGLIAMWRVAAGHDDEPERGHTAGLHDACLRAVQTALMLQIELLRQQAEDADNPIRIRTGVGSGRLEISYVGGEGQVWEEALAGSALEEACAAERAAAPGRVVAGPRATELIAARCKGSRLADGFFLVHDVTWSIDASALERPAVDARAAETLDRHVVEAVSSRLDAGCDDWLSDHRPITTMFVSLASPARAGLDALNGAVRSMQRVLARAEGTFVRAGIGARGPTVLAAFGLPPFAHEDDAVRAVGAALDIRAAIVADGLTCSIGMTTGRSFCGVVGSEHRREYTMLGESVNLAARLMDHAAGAILCDRGVIERAGRRVRWDASEEIRVKGRTRPVVVARPSSLERRPTVPMATMIGRESERNELSSRLDALRNDATTSIVILEGEAGIGKSRLVVDLVERGRAADGVRTVEGAADALHAWMPYHAWSSIFAKLLDVDDPTADAAVLRERATARLESLLARQDPDDHAPRDLVPLVEAVVPLGFEETTRTALMSEQARGDGTRSLLIRILAAAAAESPLLLVLEDAHWLDSASWGLARLVVSRVEPLLLVLASRPLTKPCPEELEIRGDPRTYVLPLSALERDDALAVVSARLGVQELPREVADFVIARAGGRPFFLEQLALALRDAGALVHHGGRCRLAPEISDLASLELPESAEGVVRSRIDRLPSSPKLVLKLASVLGRSFDLAALQAIHPAYPRADALVADLDLLEREELIELEGTGVGAARRFKHVITQTVAYAEMLIAWRRQLHHAAARWYESTVPAESRSPLAVIAHHRLLAIDPDHPDLGDLAFTLDALERAGLDAFERYANREALRHFSSALRLRGDRVAVADGERVARWHRYAGEAQFRLGEPAAARDHLLACLRHLGEKPPTGALRLPWRLAEEAGRQVWRRLVATRLGRVGTGRNDDACTEIAGAYELLGLVLYLMNQRAPSLLANLRALNLAELGPPAVELATSAGTAGMSLGIVSGRRVADTYFDLALAAARTLGDRYAHGRVLHMRGFYLLGQGSWEDSKDALETAAREFDELGEERWREMVVLSLGNLHYMHRRFEESLPLYDEAARTSRERGDVQSEAWSAIGTAGALLALGRIDRCLETIASMESWLTRSFKRLSDRGSEFSITAIHAAAWLRRGQPARALETLERAERISAEGQLPMYYALPGYALTAGLRLELLEHTTLAGVDRRRARSLARNAVAELWRFSRFFPIAHAEAWLCRGRLQWLLGRPAAARRSWEEALEAAQRFDMRYEEGLASFEIGNHEHDDDRLRMECLTRARDSFAIAGCAWDLARVEGVLRGVPDADDRTRALGQESPAT
jgi:class 3 adenylate cyclase/tetratricopeptide (TPR) repeat protein